MRCLSIRQPWAFLVCAGAKCIENRTRSSNHRGTIAIHAGGFRRAVECIQSPEANKELFSFGAIIGVADLYDVVPLASVREEEWAEGPFCYLFRNARLFVHPISHRGRVNLCELPDAVEAEVMERSKECVNVPSMDDIRKTIAAIPKGPIDKTHLRPSSRIVDS